MNGVASRPVGHLAWIEDVNRFTLAAPPVYFLQRLYDYDSQLVIIPSRKEPKYLLARRRFHTAGFKSLAGQMDPHPDTLMLDEYHLLPVSTIVQTGASWNADEFIRALHARDTWAHGAKKADGGDALVDRIEAQEREAEQDHKQAIRQDMDYRSRDAYRSYKARTGQSTIRHTMRRAGQRLWNLLPGLGHGRKRETVHDPSEPAWRG